MTIQSENYKTSYIMKTALRFFYLALFLIAGITGKANNDSSDYLKKVLANLEKIESASYYEYSEGWQPGDTTSKGVHCSFINEYNNPLDTAIGSSFVKFDCESKFLDFGYDGKVRASVYNDKKGIIIDNFTARPLPFRPIRPPFFNYTKNLILYTLTTNDSITLERKDSEDDFYFKLTINEPNQIEFFGKPHRIPDNSQYWGSTTSIYELWINKEKGLPYKVRREMSHDISERTCNDAVFNELSIENFNLYSYFPEDYEIRKYKIRNQPQEESPLVGQQAPSWTLNDKDEQSMSLSDFKGKVLLIQFTGIGCGPCVASIPFLRTLKEKYSADKFELLAIETWTRRPHSLRVYSDKHKLNYAILSAIDDVVKNYQTGGAAPVFFVLDKDQIIRKVLTGYTKQGTEEEIEKGINELL